MSTPWSRWLAANDTHRYQLSRKAGWDAFVNGSPRPDFAALTREEMAGLSDAELGLS